MKVGRERAANIGYVAISYMITMGSVLFFLSAALGTLTGSPSGFLSLYGRGKTVLLAKQKSLRKSVQ